jgi:hypothetical protein
MLPHAETAFIDEEASHEVRTFETATKGLLGLADWLGAAGCTQVAMESTRGLLEAGVARPRGHFELVRPTPHIAATCPVARPPPPQSPPPRHEDQAPEGNWNRRPTDSPFGARSAASYSLAREALVGQMNATVGASRTATLSAAGSRWTNPRH